MRSRDFDDYPEAWILVQAGCSLREMMHELRCGLPRAKRLRALALQDFHKTEAWAKEELWDGILKLHLDAAAERIQRTIEARDFLREAGVLKE